MTTACAYSTCSRPAQTRGYCPKHYRHRLHTGRYGYRDAGTARAHVARLRALGWTWQAIGDTAGISTWVAYNLHRGTTRRLLAETEAALLSVPLRRVESHRGVPAVGTRRRVRALACLGWPAPVIAQRCGVAARTLTRELSRGSVSQRLATRVRRVYDELSGTPGPSRVAAGKARQLGFHPPAAWLPETIDDPDANPLPWVVNAA